MGVNTHMLPYLVLLQAGFAMPRHVAIRAVRSYRTISPLPIPKYWRYLFCGTFHGFAPSRRYLAPCLTEPGLSSAIPEGTRRLPGRLLLSQSPHACGPRIIRPFAPRDRRITTQPELFLVGFERKHASIELVFVLPRDFCGDCHGLLAGQHVSERLQQLVGAGGGFVA